MIDNAFISQYDKYISYCIHQYCKPPIDDFKQDIYLKLCETPFRHENVKSYIAIVVRNYFYEKYRTDQRKKNPEKTQSLVIIPDESHSIYKEVVEKLRNLPGGKCLRLYAEGYKYREIAELLHISLYNVQISIYRARKKINAKSKSESCRI